MKIKIGPWPKNKPRKVNIEIEKFDTWNMEHTLALIILPMLVQLKAQKMGIPAEFADVGGGDFDDQYSFDFYNETHNECFEKGVERWDEVLDKMIWSFQQIVDGSWEEAYRHGEANITWEPTEEKIMDPVTGKMEEAYQMVDKNPHEHWTDLSGMKEHEKRIQEGLELFGKYFRNLWD